VVNWIHCTHRILEIPLALALGEVVRLLRENRGWSREELAGRANISSRTVRNIEEQFVMWPQPATIGGLARAFGISVNQLMHPEEEGEAEDWRSHLAKLEQQKLGARWVEGDGRFAIDPTGAESDVDAANQPIVQQLHPPIIQKASLFNDISKRLDNALGWHGIAAASQRFLDGVDRPTQHIPNHLGSIYSAILELGSFLEQDSKLQRGSGYSADPLDPEIHRVLSDLIRTAAPWLRQFPTVRELDDQSGAFLTRGDLLDPGVALINRAQNNALVSSTDAAAILGLVDAAKRGEFQGDKARTRGVFSVRNLLIVTATAVLSFFSGGAASNYAEKSRLMDHAGRFLAQSEDEITTLVADFPDDLRLAFQELLKEIREHPEMFLEPRP
jgi:transcriptional regulator with XRE-family HTH domain